MISTTESIPDLFTASESIFELPDFDGNGLVEQTDLDFIKSRQDTNYGDNNYLVALDHNLDTKIDSNDIAWVESNIGNPSPETDQITGQILQNVLPYFEEEGLLNAIEDGFIPFTTELRYHGTHYFDPLRLVEPPDPARPAGLNFDENNRLVAVFWANPKYGVASYANLDFAELVALPEAEATAFLENFKAENLKPVSNILALFGDEIHWHSHEDTVFRNLGAKDPTTGLFDAEAIDFTQGVPASTLFADTLEGFTSDEIVITPYEQDLSLGYPPFNTLITPGFYMIHQWIGLPNPDGLFAGIHEAVSPEAPPESTTFADGSGGHGHGMGDPPPLELRFGTPVGDVLDSGDGVGFDGDRDLVFTGRGDDQIFAGIGLGANRIYAGSQADEIEVGNRDRAFGGEGVDTITAFGNHNRIYGGGEADFLEVIDGGMHNRIFGGEGDDLIDSTLGGGNNRAYGGEGDDYFFLGTGDILVGGEDDDSFFAMGGDNRMTGGSGMDAFWVLTSTELPDMANVVVDFDLDEDIIGVGGGFSAEDLSFDGDTLFVNDQAVAIFSGVTHLSVEQITFA